MDINKERNCINASESILYIFWYSSSVQEPEFGSGWGFCSTDKDQEQCNSFIQNVRDHMPHHHHVYDGPLSRL